MGLKQDFLGRYNPMAAGVKEKTNESEENGKKMQGNALTRLATIL